MGSYRSHIDCIFLDAKKDGEREKPEIQAAQIRRPSNPKSKR